MNVSDIRNLPLEERRKAQLAAGLEDISFRTEARKPKPKHTERENKKPMSGHTERENHKPNGQSAHHHHAREASPEPSTSPSAWQYFREAAAKTAIYAPATIVVGYTLIAIAKRKLLSPLAPIPIT